jgi:hypothetical protein
VRFMDGGAGDLAISLMRYCHTAIHIIALLSGRNGQRRDCVDLTQPEDIFSRHLRITFKCPFFFSFFRGMPRAEARIPRCRVTFTLFQICHAGMRF